MGFSDTIHEMIELSRNPPPGYKRKSRLSRLGKSFTRNVKRAAPVAGAIIGNAIAPGAGTAIGASIGGGLAGSQAEEDAAEELELGQNALIDEQRSARDQAREDLQPFTQFGLSAGEQLQNLLNDPTQGLEEINPVVDILRKQGFESIQESAASRGRLGAGGTLKDLTQFNTDLATTVAPQLQNQRFNQLFNVLAQGQNAAAGQGTATLQTANPIGNALGNIGTIGGNRVIGQANEGRSTMNSIFNALGGFGGGFGGGGDSLADLTQNNNSTIGELTTLY